MIQNMPQELTTRLPEIESIFLKPYFAMTRTSLTSGYYVVPVPYTAPLVKIENLSQTETMTSVADITNGTPFDVTKIIRSLLQNSTQQNTIRFSATGTASLSTTAHALPMTVNYSRDVDQVSRAFYTPLVVNPKDGGVYDRVLSVLARIDREVVTASNTLISKATYDEIKNIGFKNDDIVALFVAQEKLQKDQTLASVWQAIFIKYNIKITREALEELYLVWQNKLLIPSSSDSYSSLTKNLIFDRNSFEILSVVPGVPSIRSLADDITFTQKYSFSRQTLEELTSASYSSNSMMIMNTSFTKANKLELLKQIYQDTLEKKKIALTREALEEMYYFFKGNIIFPVVAPSTVSSPVILEFNRTSFGMLEPILVDGVEIVSTNENTAEENITYALSGHDIKIISSDTRQELAIAGITTREQITQIMKSTNTVLKDSKLGFFYKYSRDKLGYEFSREALEEIYLVYIGQALYNAPSTSNTLTESSAFSVAKPEWSGSTNPCTATYNGNYAQYNTSCTLIFNSPQKE